MNNNILVFVVAGIGDFLEAVPALASLREARPIDSITIIVSERVYPYAQHCPFVDHIIPFQVQQGSVSSGNIISRLAHILQLRKQHFDVVINLKEVDSWAGSVKLLAMILLLNPRMTIGRNTNGKGWFFRKQLMEHTASAVHNQPWYFNQLVEMHTQVPVVPTHYKPLLWSIPGDQEKLAEILAGVGLQEGDAFFIINPGSDRPTRRWQAAAFAQVADHVTVTHAMKAVIIGSSEEIPLALEIKAAMRTTTAVSLAGKFTLSQLILLIAKARIVFTTNSAVMHIAGLTAAPVVAIAGSGNPVLDIPSGDTKKIALLWKDISCNPCYNYECPGKNQNACMNIISPDDAIAAGEHLLL